MVPMLALIAFIVMFVMFVVVPGRLMKRKEAAELAE